MLAPINPVSQSCAVAKSKKFWQATGQPNLADRWKNVLLAKAQSCEYENQTLETFVAASHYFVSRAWLSSGPSDFLLWATAHDCETNL